MTGSVDAVAVTVSGATSGNSRPITANTIFKFNVINVNIRGGYDPNTGTNYPLVNYKLRNEI